MIVPRVKMAHDGCGTAWFLAMHPTNRLDMLGWGQLEFDNGRIWLSIFVQPTWQRQRIGASILSHMMCHADDCSLELSLSSKPHLVDMYKALGFEAQAMQGIKAKPGQVLMVREPQT